MSPPPLVARALDLPGALFDSVGRTVRPAFTADPGALSGEGGLAKITASPRANAYLSLEPGLAPLETADGLLSVAVTKRHAFAVGGVHLTPATRLDPDRTERATVELLTQFRLASAAAGYRRALLFPVEADELVAVRAAGFEALEVGAEAHIDLQRYTIAGRRHADLRQMINRATKRYRLRVLELNAAEAESVAAGVVEGWLGSRPLKSRMRLLVGSPCFDRPALRRFFVCCEPGSDEAVALITTTPGWDGQGAGLDVMARAPTAPAGAMELLVHHAITTLIQEGARYFSLGACPMALRSTQRVPKWRHRVLRWVFRRVYRSSILNRLFHFHSLVQFKSKFAPDWRPVYIAGWPRVSLGALYAGCRMWGLFGSDPCLPPRVALPDLVPIAETRRQA